MRIFKQTNNNDCGICVTQSLIYHFYKKEIDRDELIDVSKISKEGLSILDLENLNDKYGIQLETYEANFNDFASHKTKDYFLLMLKYEYGNHYVIAKKNNTGVTIFDSINGKKNLSYHELKKYYGNIYIEIFKYKKNIDSKPFFDQKLINIDFKIILQVFLIDLIVIKINIVSGYFIKSIFNNVISSNDIANLGIIIFIAIFSYLSIGFGNILIGVIENKQRNLYHQKLTIRFTDYLLQKIIIFFQKFLLIIL